MKGGVYRMLTHKAYLVNMTGLSYRLKETQKMRQDK